MAGTGFHCFANYRALIPRTATTILYPWQSAFQCSADCQPPLSGLIRTMRGFTPLAIRSQIRSSDYSNPRYSNFLCGNPPGKHRDMPIQRYEFERGV
jgi:hypothetical protein